MLAARPAAPQDHADHAVDGDEAVGEGGQIEAGRDEVPPVRLVVVRGRVAPVGVGGTGDTDDARVEVHTVWIALVARDLRLEPLAGQLLVHLPLAGVEDLADATPGHAPRLAPPGACGSALVGTVDSMQTRTIGTTTVSAIGLGGMPMSIEGRPDRDRSIATIHAALDAGITFIDTADAYHLNADEVGHNESLIAEALASWGGDTSDVLVATKGGHLRPGDGSWTIDSSPEHLREAADASLKRLGVDAIGLYQLHRPDTKVPYAESVGAVRDLLDAGKITMAGISNANPAQIREAQEVLGGRLVSVQNQYSPAYLSSKPELELCDELGIAFLPWSPLGGISKASDLGSTYAAFQKVADAHGVSPQQVTLAWMLQTSPVVVPIPGSSRPETIRDSAKAADLTLTSEEMDQLSQA